MDKQKGQILRIICLGHPTLIKPAAKIIDPTDKNIQQIDADLRRTARKLGNAVGLAATQVNIPLQIFIYREDLADDFVTVINPQISTLNPAKGSDWEACFSIPGFIGKVDRFQNITLKYQDLSGTQITENLSGFKARVAQHETDHLNSKLYIHRLTSSELFGFEKEIKRNYTI